MRDRAIMELMYSSGLRLAELVGLQPRGREARTSASSGSPARRSRERVPAMGRMAVEWLQRRLKVRPLLAGDESRGAVRLQAPAAAVGPLGTGAARRLGQQQQALQRRTSIPTSCATASSATCWSPPAICGRVQELLGHADLSTTQICTHLDFQHLAKVCDNAHPERSPRDGDPQQGAGGRAHHSASVIPLPRKMSNSDVLEGLWRPSRQWSRRE